MLLPPNGQTTLCTVGQRKPKGILTTYQLHCASEQLQRASLEATFSATPHDAPVITPLPLSGS